MKRNGIALTAALGITLAAAAPIAPSKAAFNPTSARLLMWVYTTGGTSAPTTLSTFSLGTLADSMAACQAQAKAIVKPSSNDIGPDAAVRVRCIPQ